MDRKAEILFDRKTLDAILEKYGKDDVMQFLDNSFDDDSGANYFDSFVSDDKQNLNELEKIKNFFKEIGFINSTKDINLLTIRNDSKNLSLGNKMVEFYNLLFNTEWGTCGIQFDYDHRDSNNIYKLDLSYPQIYYLTIIIMSLGFGRTAKDPIDGIDYFVGEGYADAQSYGDASEPDEYVYYILKMFFRSDIKGSKYMQQYFRNFYKFMFLDNTLNSSMYDPGMGVFGDFCENYNDKAGYYASKCNDKTINQYKRLHELGYDICKQTNWECYEYDNIKNSCHYAAFVFNKYIKS